MIKNGTAVVIAFGSSCALNEVPAKTAKTRQTTYSFFIKIGIWTNIDFLTFLNL